MHFDSLIFDLALDQVGANPGFKAGVTGPVVRTLGTPQVGRDGIVGAYTEFQGANGFDATVSGLGPDGAMTFAFWVRVRSAGTGAVMMEMSDLGQVGGYTFSVSPSGTQDATIAIHADPMKSKITFDIPLDTWRHIAISQERDKIHFLIRRTIFVNGNILQTTGDALSPIVHGAKLRLGAIPNSDPDALFDMTNVRVFDRALFEDTLQQLIAADRTPLGLLNETEPLNIRLLGKDGTPSIFIEDHKDGHALTLEVQNVSSTVVQLEPRKNTTVLNLTFPPGTLDRPRPRNTGQRIEIEESHQWRGTYIANPDGSLRLQLKPVNKAIVMRPNDVRSITLKHVRAELGEGTRPCRVLFDYEGVERDGPRATHLLLSGSREKLLQIINHTGSQFTPLKAELIGRQRLRNGETDGSLQLSLRNTSTDRVIALEGPVAQSGQTVPQSAFILQLTADPKAKSSNDPLPAQQILQQGTTGTIVVSPPAGWSVEQDAVDGPTPRWIIYPTTDTTLNPGATVDLHISGMAVSKTPGTAPITLIHRGLPGFWYGEQTLSIEKSPFYFDQDDWVGINNSDPQGILHVHNEKTASAVVISSPAGHYAELSLRPEGHEQSFVSATLNEMNVSTWESVLYLGAGQKGWFILTDPPTANQRSLADRICGGWDDDSLSSYRDMVVKNHSGLSQLFVK